MRRRRLLALLATLVFGCAASVAAAQSQSGYRFRDANGQWVFTDRTAGDTASGGAPLSLAHEPDALHADIERVDLGSSTRLVAVNDCLCVVTLRAWIQRSDLAQIPAGTSYQATLQPGASRTLVEAQRADGAKGQLQFAWRRTLGAPDAVHTPPRPYRAPFALGATFLVSQAFPTRVTHVTPDSVYAVDIALPDGTPVYAARAGTVINVRHDSFSGAPLPALLDQANVVEVLHEDGTIAIYAHLHWDSIRVRIGQRVQLGEYLANSGNTGFTTGPHLHFAVWRNSGSGDVSVPVQFAGPGGLAVTPATAQPLTAY